MCRFASHKHQDVSVRRRRRRPLYSSRWLNKLLRAFPRQTAYLSAPAQVRHHRTYVYTSYNTSSETLLMTSQTKGDQRNGDSRRARKVSVLTVFFYGSPFEYWFAGASRRGGEGGSGRSLTKGDERISC